MAIVSQLLRFIIPRSSVKRLAFTELRRRVETTGFVKTQYFGYVLQNEGFPKPKPENQMCWYIEWPEKCLYRTSQEFILELASIAEDKLARSLVFNFKETKSDEVIKGLESHDCEFAIISLSPEAPRFDNEFEHSMDKTFTDCYLAKGFIGGGWGYAINTNDSEGKEISPSGAEDSLLEDKERMLAYYVIGWDSIEEHQEFAKTALFDMEIDKLKPYFGPGTGAFYVSFERYS